MRINPDWEFKIYTDADNRALIADHYPWFLKTYDGYPVSGRWSISTCDTISYLNLIDCGSMLFSVHIRQLTLTAVTDHILTF
jgi:hypothetical protein